MSDRIMEWLDESQRLADKATAGPWGHWPEAGTVEVTADNHATVICNAVRPQGGWGAPIYQGGTEPTAEFIAEARTRLPQAVAALRAVMELHQPSPYSYPDGSAPCRECNRSDGTGLAPTWWPCTTLRAITADLGLEGDDDDQ